MGLGLAYGLGGLGQGAASAMMEGNKLQMMQKQMEMQQVQHEVQKQFLEAQGKHLISQSKLQDAEYAYLQAHPEAQAIKFGGQNPMLANLPAIMAAFGGGQQGQAGASPGASVPAPSSAGPNIANSAAQIMQGPLAQTIAQVAMTNQLPPELLARLTAVESGGRNVQNAQGKPYFGPLQVGMPAAQSVWGQDAMHPSQMTPDQNIATGAAYLRQLIDKNQGQINPALKQYGGFVSADPTSYINGVTGGAQALAGGQAPAGAGSGMPQLDMKNVLMAGIIKQLFGVDMSHQLFPEPKLHPAGNEMWMTEGNRVTQKFPVNRKLELKETESPGGAKQIVPFDPYTGMPALGGGTPGSPAPAGTPSAPPKQETAVEAGRQQLAQTGIDALNEMKSMVYNPDGTINKWNVVNSTVGTPWSSGRRLSQLAENAIDGIVRAATGAALNETEIKSYTRRYVPLAWDDEKTIKSKLQQLDGFLNGYLEKMDPTGAMRKRTGKYSEIRAARPQDEISNFKKMKGL